MISQASQHRSSLGPANRVLACTAWGLAILSSALLQLNAAAGTLQIQASRHQTTGCSFTGSTEGALGLSSNFMELSTEFAGGSRPTLSVSVIGSATLSLRSGITWSRDETLLTDVSTLGISLHSSAQSNTPLSMPLRIMQGGHHTFYLQTLGSSPKGFFESGHYKATALFDCI